MRNRAVILDSFNINILEERDQGGFRQYEMRNDIGYLMRDGARALVPKGFKFNGASSPINAGKGLKSAALHDYAYARPDSAFNEAKKRWEIDLYFRQCLVDIDSNPRWRAWTWWLAVRFFGGKHFNKKND